MPRFKPDFDHLDGDPFAWRDDGSHIPENFVPQSERQANLDALRRQLDAQPADAAGPQVAPDGWDPDFHGDYAAQTSGLSPELKQQLYAQGEKAIMSATRQDRDNAQRMKGEADALLADFNYLHPDAAQRPYGEIEAATKRVIEGYRERGVLPSEQISKRRSEFLRDVAYEVEAGEAYGKMGVDLNARTALPSWGGSYVNPSPRADEDEQIDGDLKHWQKRNGFI